MIADTLNLIRADMLKLWRRRGLIAIALVASVGVASTFVAVYTIRHLMHPLHNSPAGDNTNFGNAIDTLGVLGFVVASLIGVTAGAGDAELGVLRDLVATGRSRWALFASRCVAAAGTTVALLVAALVVATVPVALASSAHAASLSEIVRSVAVVLGFGASAALACAAIATFMRSRGPLMASAIAAAFVSLEVLRISFLGNFRAVLPMGDLQRMMDSATSISTSKLAFSTPLAIAVLAAWTVAAVATGGWWAQRIEV